jgi:U3 small nucleolar RNA-associated protein 24
MGVAKKTRKFGAVRTLLFPPPPQKVLQKANTTQVKRVIGQNDARLKKNQAKGELESKKKEKGADVVREVYICLPSFAIPS